MLTIYRPYLLHSKTVKVLHKTDIAKMKYDSYLLINIICEKMGWVPKTKLSKMHKNDVFVKFYYNNGRPYMDCLLEYYYILYFGWLKNCGEEHDWAEQLNGLYEENKKQCKAGDPWKKAHALTHKMYLLKWDEHWYKRHFRKHYIFKIKDYKLTESKKPKRTFKKDLIKFREHLPIDELDI